MKQRYGTELRSGTLASTKPEIVQRLGCQMTSSSQCVQQADGSSPLHVVGETRFSLNREGRGFTIEGLVIENLDVDVLASTPFMETNDIAVRPAKRQVILDNGSIVSYGSPHPATVNSAARRAIVLHSPPTSMTVWPGEFVEVDLPRDVPPDSEYALEPQTDAPSVRKLSASQLWPAPRIFSSVAGKIRIPNLSSELHFFKRNEHFCQVRATFTPEPPGDNSPPTAKPPPKPPVPMPGTKHSSNVRHDPDSLFVMILEQSSLRCWTCMTTCSTNTSGLQWCGRSIRSQSQHGTCGPPPPPPSG